MSTNPVNDSPQSIENELQLLEALSGSPETTQADLAARVGVAVGTVNWYLKRWSQKGFVKIRRIGRWNWSYLLTAEGLAHKRQLAGEYITSSFALYRRVRMEAKRLITEVTALGINQIILHGEGEIADICRLTCLEEGVVLLLPEASSINPRIPTLFVEGIELRLRWVDDPRAEMAQAEAFTDGAQCADLAGSHGSN